jgi:hypothetical protein
LGIINTRAQNNALLVKQLDKFYNKDIPWVHLIWNAHYSNREVPHATKNKGSFWRRAVLKLVDQFRGISSYIVGDGTTVLFWLDIWNNHLLHNKYPRLFSFAKKKQKYLSCSIPPEQSNRDSIAPTAISSSIPRISRVTTMLTTNPSYKPKHRQLALYMGKQHLYFI